MRRAGMLATVVTVVVTGGATVLALASGKGSTCANDANSSDPAACDAGAKTATVARAPGKVLGHFDVAMAGCRFACATKSKYDAKSVVAQPGAKKGGLTQCPVSGVVFGVDAARPHVRVGADQYVTCCDACAKKLRKDPRRFVRV
jgi:hypothetical protein